MATAAPTYLRRLRLSLADGAHTTAHVTTYRLSDTRVSVRRLPAFAPLGLWCEESGVEEALVGGFYLREQGTAPGAELTAIPLGELWVDGAVQPFIPFTEPWGSRRACVHADGGAVRIDRRAALPAQPAGDLLQAGPLLVHDGLAVPGDEEGFSAGAGQFDSDITDGRHPRAALGCDGERVIALACDGRAEDEAGLTLGELAQTMIDLGAREALNLDGGGSTSLVSGGVLRNVPREGFDLAVPGGRAIATALVFSPH